MIIHGRFSASGCRTIRICHIDLVAIANYSNGQTQYTTFGLASILVDYQIAIRFYSTEIMSQGQSRRIEFSKEGNVFNSFVMYAIVHF